MIIAPSILTDDLSNLSTTMKTLEEGGADWLHIDVMDGNFVPNITFGAQVVRLAKKTIKIPLDVHLMINRPEDHIEEFAKAGANTITIHQEVSPHLHRNLMRIRELGCKAGVAINPSTPVECIKNCLDVCDLILIMSGNPGFPMQTFLPNSVNKIKEAKKLIGDKDICIQVDCGINLVTGKLSKEAGADAVVVGAYILNSVNWKETITNLKNV